MHVFRHWLAQSLIVVTEPLRAIIFFLVMGELM